MQDVVNLFFALDTQWRWIAGVAGALRVGLDYQAVQATAAMAGVEVTPDLFSDLQVMERAALKVWADD